MIDEEKNIFPFFLSISPDEFEVYGEFIVLGDKWPFNLSLHPAILELYEKREDKMYSEQVLSTEDGIEALYSYVPLVVDGEVVCAFCAGYTMESIRNALADEVKGIELVNILLMKAAAAVLLIMLYFFVLKKLAFVQKTIRRYRETKDFNEIREMLKMLQSTNEIGVLADDFSDMAVEMELHMKKMMNLSAERERISTELELATRIQSGMLPDIFSALPDRKEFDVSASMTPAKNVGGDFYDFFLLDDSHLGIVIADVSRKGVPAALFMMVTKMLVQKCAMTSRNPSEVLQAVNKRICANNPKDMFVTVCFGILDITTGVITASNAGHECPAVMMPGGKFELFRDKHSVVIGGMEGADYTQYEIKLTPGSKLFVYTDGVPKAENADKEIFGTARMLDALNINTTASPQDILQNVSEAVNDFVKDAEQSDDFTMLCLEYMGCPSEK